MINLLKVARYIRDHRTLEADYTSDFTVGQLEAFRLGVIDGMGDYVKLPTCSREYRICDLWYRYYNLGEKSVYWNASHERTYLLFETSECNFLYECGVRIAMTDFQKVTYKKLCHPITKIYLHNAYKHNKVAKSMISACGANLYAILDEWSCEYMLDDLVLNSLVTTLHFMNYLNEVEFNLYIYIHSDCKTDKNLFKTMLFDLNYRFNYSDYCHNLIWLKKKSYISWTAYAYLMRKAKIRLKEYMR